MEQKRIKEKQNITENIRQLRKYIETDEATIARYKQNSNNDFNMTQIDKMTLKNEERQAQIEKSEKRYNDIELGLCDQEINEEYTKISNDIKQKTIETKRKKDIEKEDKKVLEIKSKVFYDNGKNSDKKFRYTQRDMDKSYQYFLKINDTVPDYMLKKLKNMPANKGYIWRSVFCFGEQKAELNQPLFMFETKKGVLITHEWTVTDYNVWEKKENSNRILKHSEKRKVIKSGYSLFDCFVDKDKEIITQSIPEPILTEPSRTYIPRENNNRNYQRENNNNNYQNRSTNNYNKTRDNNQPNSHNNTPRANNTQINQQRNNNQKNNIQNNQKKTNNTNTSNNQNNQQKFNNTNTSNNQNNQQKPNNTKASSKQNNQKKTNNINTTINKTTNLSTSIQNTHEPKGDGEAVGEMVGRVDRELELLGAGRLRSNEAEAVPTPQRNLVICRRGRGNNCTNTK